MAKNTPLSVAVILDTNVLEELPESLESGELSNLAGLVWRVFVPDIVAREWQAHRMMKASESYKALRKVSKHLAGYNVGVVEAQKLAPGSGAKIAHQLAWRLRAVKLRVYRPPKVSLRSLTMQSAYHIPPFQSANRGFKDELVVKSVLEIASRWNWGACILVSKDSIFEEETIRNRVTNEVENFYVAKSIKEAIDKLDKFLDAAQRQQLENEEKELIQLATKHWDEIARQVQRNALAKGVYSFELKEALKQSDEYALIPFGSFKLTQSN